MQFNNNKKNYYMGDCKVKRKHITSSSKYDSQSTIPSSGVKTLGIAL